MDDMQLQRLAELISSSGRIVFFGGAGVSQESGIPDFRSADGLYHQKWRYPPELILSHGFFLKKTEEFYQFYKEKMLFPHALPNGAHRALAALEERGLLSAVITQNIDGLHQAAGSRRVIELHGSVHRNFCTRCKKSFDLEKILSMEGVPHCPCGGVIKPDVVLYGEALPAQAIREALHFIETADLLIIGGTSLTVYPAAQFVADYPGPIAIINRSATAMDERADLVIDAPIGQVMERVMQLIS